MLKWIPVVPERSTPRVGVVTTTRGGAAIMVDQLALRGLTIRRPSHGLVGQMNAAGAQVPHSLIADLGLAGEQHGVVVFVIVRRVGSGESVAVDVSRTSPELTAP